MGVINELISERTRQDRLWGEQNHPDGTGDNWRDKAEGARILADEATRLNCLTWLDILREEFFEALAETDPVKLRTELLQVAAVAVAWVEAIDRRPWAEAMHRFNDEQ